MIDSAVPLLKSDWRRLRHSGDRRSAAEITEHFLLERDLAARLRDANAENRSRLYSELYGELFSRLPSHPRFTLRPDDSNAAKQVAILTRLVPADSCFLEIGAGDGGVTLRMAEHCREAIAVDVTEPIIHEPPPTNFRFVLTDGLSLPLPSGTVDFVYSHQLMEHLHPKDAPQQLREIHRVLRPGGRYFCITPTRLTGPHDVSRFFHDEAEGFHLKEYTYADIDRLFAEAGFDRRRACITRGRHYAGSVPASTLVPIERLFARLPGTLRRRLNTNRWLRALLGVAVLAHKPTTE